VGRGKDGAPFPRTDGKDGRRRYHTSMGWKRFWRDLRWPLFQEQLLGWPWWWRIHGRVRGRSTTRDGFQAISERMGDIDRKLRAGMEKNGSIQRDARIRSCSRYVVARMDSRVARGESLCLLMPARYPESTTICGVHDEPLRTISDWDL